MQVEEEEKDRGRRWRTEEDDRTRIQMAGWRRKQAGVKQQGAPSFRLDSAPPHPPSRDLWRPIPIGLQQIVKQEKHQFLHCGRLNPTRVAPPTTAECLCGGGPSVIVNSDALGEE